VIAAVNGPAAGAGLALVPCADDRLLGAVLGRAGTRSGW